MISLKISQFLQLALIFTLLAVPAQAEKLKVATVDMSALVQQYHRFQSAQKEKQLEIDEIAEEERDRLQSIQALEGELQMMIKEMKDPSFSIAKREAIREQAVAKENDLRALKRALQLYLQQRDEELRKKMASVQNEIVTAVMDKVNAYAETRDVDLVMDESGISRSEFPFLIYVRDKIDLTGPVLKLLNADAPQESGSSDGDVSSNESGE